MPLSIERGAPTLLFRRESYERTKLMRFALDARLGLTDAEFRVEKDVVAIGPIYDAEALGLLVDELEANGLTYYEDFFEMSGNWPKWLSLMAIGATAT